MFEKTVLRRILLLRWEEVKSTMEKKLQTTTFKICNLGSISLYRVEQRKRMFFKWLVRGKCGVDDVGREPADSSDNTVSVAMAHWNVQHRVFVVKQFFRNRDSVVTVQRWTITTESLFLKKTA